MKSNPDIIWLDVAESSNDEARRAIDSLDNLSVVAVRCQTKGRGQRTNTWETAPGQNLTFSVVLKDFEILPKEQIAISQITALSVVDFLRMHGIESNIKLPNDIYVGNKKKACEYCGIYSEEYALPAETTENELLELVQTLNNKPDIHGILVQLPLPKHLDEKEVIAFEGAGVSAKVAVSASTENFGEIIILKNKEF